MFLHLLVGELQTTPAVARHLGNQYKALQCLKLEIVHQNQLVEYGLISKETKVDSLFPFHQTIHIPLDSYFEPIDGLNEDDDSTNGHLQKLSFALFAVLGRQTMVKLGSGVMSSTRNGKHQIVSKTVVLRSDQFEIVGKVAVTTAYHDSLLDINNLLQLKKDSPGTSKQRQQQEYSFLLSRKFRRSEADFPATFDHTLDYQAKQDSKHYIENLQKESRSRPHSTARGKKEATPRKPSPKLVRKSSSQGRAGNHTEKQSHSKPSLQLHSTMHSEKSREPISSGLSHTVEAPKLRKTVMSVGFVHNSWPDPLQHEREKREFQLRMADEKKQLLLQQIREEIEAQHRKSSQLQEQQRQDLEAQKERRRKKQLARELQNREQEIKLLQEELHKIRLQSILAAQQASSPPLKGRYHTPNGKRSFHQHPPHNPMKSSSEKKRAASAENRRHDQRNKVTDKLSDPRIQQLIHQGFKNFFKEVPTLSNKAKKKPAASASQFSSKELNRVSPASHLRSKASKEKVEKPSISPILHRKDPTKETPIETPLATNTVSELRDSQGNDIIKVLVTRHPSPKSTLRPTPLQARYQNIAAIHNLPRKEPHPKKTDRNRTGSEFEFHDIYNRDTYQQKFDSDQDFSQLNQQFPRPVVARNKSNKPKEEAKKKKETIQQENHEDLDSSCLLDDNEDEMKVFEQSMADDLAAIHQTICTKSREEPTVNQSLVSTHSDSTNGAYGMPGFLQTIIQEQPDPVVTNDTTDKFLSEHPPSYYADIDIEEDDEEPEDDSSSDSGFDEDDFLRQYNLLVKKEDLDKDSEESEIVPAVPSHQHQDRDDSDEVEDYLDSKELIFPSKDFDYSESSFQTDEIISKDPKSSTTIITTVEPLLETTDVLGNEDKYEFEYRSNRSTSTSTQSHPSSTARSRSREKIAQQFEKNRLYSQPSSRPISATVGNTVSSLTNTATSIASDEREEGEEEMTFSQLDELMEKASQAVTTAIRNVASDDSYDPPQKDNDYLQQIKSLPLKVAMDISLSDDDTVENNILDSISFNAKLMASSDEEEQHQKHQPKSSMEDSKDLQPPSKDMKIVDNQQESPQDLKEKLDRISSKITTLLSDAPLHPQEAKEKEEGIPKKTKSDDANLDKRSVTFSYQIQSQFMSSDEDKQEKPIPATLDYSRPSHNSSASKRSLIERQFEKNRRFTTSPSPSTSAVTTTVTASDTMTNTSITSNKEQPSVPTESPLPVVSSHITPQKIRWNDDSPTVTNKDLKTNYTIEFPATKSESVDSIPVIETSTSPYVTAAEKSNGAENRLSTEKVSLHTTPFKDSRSNSGSRVQSIISQFEKNRRYATTTTTSTSTAAVVNEQSISHPGLKRSPKTEITPPASPARNPIVADKSPTSAKPSNPAADEEVITSTVKRSNLQQDWLELEAALDKLESRVKTSDLMTNNNSNNSLSTDRNDDSKQTIHDSGKRDTFHRPIVNDGAEKATPQSDYDKRKSSQLVRGSEDHNQQEKEEDSMDAQEDDDSDTNSDDQEMLRKFMQEMDSDVDEV